MAQLLNNILEEPEKAYNTLTGWVAYGMGKHLIAPGTKTGTVFGRFTNYKGLARTLFPTPSKAPLDVLRKAGTQYAGASFDLRAARLTEISKLRAAIAPRSALRSAATTAFRTFNIAFSLSFAFSIGKGLTNWAMSAGRDVFTNRYSIPVADQVSGAAYTQRQRALAAIHNSQLSTRAILGNEAAYMH